MPVLFLIRFAPLMAAFVLLLVLAACEAPTQTQSKIQPEIFADMVLQNGVVATVDEAIGNVQALAVAGHEIIAVGSDEEIGVYINDDTQVIDLAGRFAMPGFIEGHGHFMSLGRSKQILDLTDITNWEQAVSRVAAAVDSAEPGEWIFGRGWHQDKWQRIPQGAIDGVPLNNTLNLISPNNPVLLGHASGHAAFANDAALQAAGITDATANPEGGIILRAENGRATGLLRETAQRLVARAGVEYESRRSVEEVERLKREQVFLASSEALANGVTSFQDAGADFATIDFFKQLESEGALPIRLYVMVRGESNAQMKQLLPSYLMPAEENDFLTVRSIKRQLDGALGAHGAWLLEPYIDLPNTSGLVLETLEDIQETARLAVKYGYQVNTHAIGDRANRETLDLYERAFISAQSQTESQTESTTESNGKSTAQKPDQNLVKDLRWRVEHAQHIDPIDVPRFGELGVIAAIQGVHCTSDGPWVPSRLGEERTKLTSYPWRDLIDSGAVVANGTDVPVEAIDPIASFYASVSRMTNNGKKFHPQQAMTRTEALASYTINNAYAAFEEDHKGSLTPGKLADIVVLSQNILSVSEAQIPDTQVDMTIVAGQVRFQR
ncbi:MAG: putative amidohydrolase YtcJ [Candidatus Azotimanducaceae bacterium]|jgi:predicted amidohydrolase YtcJ|tara:strand:- start:11011 stop:12840 length:1830 start_codon:yes stop_codon:yes gene_type:complete